MPARSGKGSGGGGRGNPTEGNTGAAAEPVSAITLSGAPADEAAGSGGSGRKGRKRTSRVESASDSVVFAIYTHAQERERYRALADGLKVTHGELLTLLLDMTEELLESGRLEVRFKTVTVRKTKPEYVLKTPRAAAE